LWQNGTGILTLDGATIRNNRAVNGGGIDINNTAARLVINSGSTIQSNMATGNGSGIRSIGKIEMNGGAIANNIANVGGGVLLNNAAAIFEMNGGAIKRNEAQNGGGVNIASGTMTMTGGQIEYNKATNGNGGGVRVGGTFIRNGNIVENNTSTAGSPDVQELPGSIYIP